MSSNLLQIMPVGSDLGLKCLQRLSAHDTSYDNNLSKLEIEEK